MTTEARRDMQRLMAAMVLKDEARARAILDAECGVRYWG
jgi:hypothetical protein